MLRGTRGEYNMERQQEREPLGAQQPIPLVQILPDGRLAYVSMPVMPSSVAPPQPFAAHLAAQDLTGKRDRWATIVKIAGILMLLGGILGVLARVCTVGEMHGHKKWGLWSAALVMDVLLILTGVLGIRAGRNKTANSARSYKRFLIFFAILYVVVTGVACFVCMKHELKRIHKNENHQYRYYTDGDRDLMLPEDYARALDKAMEQVHDLRAQMQPHPVDIDPNPMTGPASEPESDLPKKWKRHHFDEEERNRPERGHRRRHDRSEDEHRPRHDWEDNEDQENWGPREDREDRRGRRHDGERRKRHDWEENEDQGNWGPREDREDRRGRRHDGERRKRHDKDDRPRHDRDEHSPRRDRDEYPQPPTPRDNEYPIPPPFTPGDMPPPPFTPGDMPPPPFDPSEMPPPPFNSEEMPPPPFTPGEMPNFEPPFNPEEMPPPPFNPSEMPNFEPPFNPDEMPHPPFDPSEMPNFEPSEDMPTLTGEEPGFMPEPRDPSIDTKHKKDKKNKKDKEDKDDGRSGYGHRDEMPKWSKEDLIHGMMVMVGVGVLLTAAMCSCCVFCAHRLVKHAENYEAMFPRPAPPPQFSYVYPQQPQMQVPYYYPVPQAPPQPVQPQMPAMPVVQAVPVSHANLYPNLAPMGVSIPHRSS